jgi:hypothetical protein
MLQLKSFAKLLLDNPHFRDGEQKVCLVLIGSSRNEGDENRIQSLRLAAKDLKIEVDRSRAGAFQVFVTQFANYYCISHRKMLFLR